MVIWVHLLRAAAALAVMFAHVHQSAQATGIGDYVPDFTIGAAGVDLFFVISGFVMVIASASLFGHAASPVYFFLRRVARIVPLYWFASGVALCVIYLIWAHFEPTNISFRNIITSLFFIPDARPDGVVQPIYSLGWTLNFEMAFYVSFGNVPLFVEHCEAVAVEVDVTRRWLGEQGRRELRLSSDVLPERHGALVVACAPSVGGSL